MHNARDNAKGILRANGYKAAGTTVGARSKGEVDGPGKAPAVPHGAYDQAHMDPATGLKRGGSVRKARAPKMMAAPMAPPPGIADAAVPPAAPPDGQPPFRRGGKVKC